MLPLRVPIADGAHFARDWYAWLRQLWEHTGAGGANHPRYVDVGVPASAMLATAALAAPDTVLLVGDGTDSNPGLYGRAFDAAAREHLWFTVTLPTSYVAGSDITPYIHWMPTDATTGNVNWAFEWGWVGPGSSPSILPEFPTLDFAAAPGVAYQLQEETYDALEGAGMEPGSTLFVTMSRRADGAADTYAADAVLVRAGFRVMVGGVGSVNAFT